MGLQFILFSTGSLIKFCVASYARRCYFLYNGANFDLWTFRFFDGSVFKLVDYKRFHQESYQGRFWATYFIIVGSPKSNHFLRTYQDAGIYSIEITLPSFRMKLREVLPSV